MTSITIPGYKIIRTLGVGGQATVYLAIQEGFEREVALKVMSPVLAADPSFGERFLREARIVAKLRHPNIVTVFDVGEHDSFYYLAMEYLPGTDLRTRISEGIKGKLAMSVIRQMADALHYAHAEGYIHRDVKSENILFRDEEQAVLTDFGIAKASNSATQMTQAGKLIGTPQYMSPEQCRGRKLDGRSDIYSLGIIFYEMMTQHVPFDGEDSVAVCLQHVTKPIPKLPVRLKHYQWLLDRMLAKKADDRFQTGGLLADEIERFLAGDTTTAQKSMSADTMVAQRDDRTQQIFDDDDEFIAPEPMLNLEAESKTRWPWIVAVLVVVGGVGFLQQQHWLPQAKQLVSEITGQPIQTPKPVTTAQPAEQKKPSVSESKLQEQPPATQTETTEQVATRVNDAKDEARAREIASFLVKADALRALPQLEPAQLRQLAQHYMQIEALEPGSQQAVDGKEHVVTQASASAQQALNQKDNPELFRQYKAVIEYVAPNHEQITMLTGQLSQYEANQTQREQRKQQQAQLQQWLKDGDKALKASRLSAPASNNAIYYYGKVLALDSRNAGALAGMKEVKSRFTQLAQKAMLDKDVAKARRYIGQLQTLKQDKAILTELRQQLNVIAQQVEEQKAIAEKEAAVKKAEEERIARLADPLTQLKISSFLDAARLAVTEKRLVQPSGDNALEKYRDVLAIDDRHQQAKDGITLVEETLLQLVREAINNSQQEEALSWFTQLKQGFPKHNQLSVLEQAIAEMDVTLEPIAQEPESEEKPTTQGDDGVNPALP
ncbi:protein kinase [Pleionea sp. CnH1-48]|uniref:serine/threonine protein kinase n=1 Tax=Pleionea sp. CnH1-48 TaxID=2954494 RepID=UPI002097826C|nr:protein kinase [Pleionea sp. CnH1-48]